MSASQNRALLTLLFLILPHGKASSQIFSFGKGTRGKLDLTA